MKRIALLGAGGKMGLRLSANLTGGPYEVDHVEIAERGREGLVQRGIQPVSLEQALKGADAVILAVPDNRIGSVMQDIHGKLAPGVMVVLLDVAAAYAGQLPDNRDLTYFITHPCHPPIFSDEVDRQAQRDFFGGEHAKQHIVCCLAQGPEGAYAMGEEIARTIYKPVMNSHRCTVEQMAILEPVLSDTILGACLTMLREATDEAVRRGVPAKAARDFLLGHMRVELAIVFEEKEGAVFSDGALEGDRESETSALPAGLEARLRAGSYRRKRMSYSHAGCYCREFSECLDSDSLAGVSCWPWLPFSRLPADWLSESWSPASTPSVIAIIFFWKSRRTVASQVSEKVRYPDAWTLSRRQFNGSRRFLWERIRTESKIIGTGTITSSLGTGMGRC